MARPSFFKLCTLNLFSNIKAAQYEMNMNLNLSFKFYAFWSQSSTGNHSDNPILPKYIHFVFFYIDVTCCSVNFAPGTQWTWFLSILLPLLTHSSCHSPIKKIFKSHLPNPAPSLGKEECHFSLCSLLRKLGLQQSYKLVKRSVHF